MSIKRATIAFVIVAALLFTAAVPLSALAESSPTPTIGDMRILSTLIELPNRATSVTVSAFIDFAPGEGTVSAIFRQQGTDSDATAPTFTGSRKITSAQAASGGTIELLVSDLSVITNALASQESVTFEPISATFTGTSGTSGSFDIQRYGGIEFAKPPKGPRVTITGDDQLTIAKGQTVKPAGWSVIYTNSGEPVTTATGAPTLSFNNSRNTATAGNFVAGVAPVISITGTDLMDPTPLNATVGSGASAVTGTSDGYIAVADLYATDGVGNWYTKTAAESVSRPASDTAQTHLWAAWSTNADGSVSGPEGGTYTWTVTQDSAAASGITISGSANSATVTVTPNTPTGSYLVTCTWTDGTVTTSCFWDLSITEPNAPSLQFARPQISLDDSPTSLHTTIHNIDNGKTISLTLQSESGSSIDLTATANRVNYLYGTANFELTEDKLSAIRTAIGSTSSITYTATATIPSADGKLESVTVSPSTITFTQRAAASLVWDKEPTDLQVDDTFDAAVSWSNESVLQGTSVTYEWTADPTEAVQITPSADGTTATIAGLLAAPRVTITVTAKPADSWPASTVVADAVTATIIVSSTESTPKVVFAPDTVTVKVGETATVSASVTGTEATPTYTWLSWGSGIATVTGNGSNATIRGVATGTVTITCGASLGTTNVTGELTVHVVDPNADEDTVSISGPDTVDVSQPITLAATVPNHPDLPASAFSWTVMAGIANVALAPSGKTCTVSAKHAGTSTIQARVDDVSLPKAITATKTLTVTGEAPGPTSSSAPSPVIPTSPTSTASTPPGSTASTPPASSASTTPTSILPSTTPTSTASGMPSPTASIPPAVLPTYRPTYWPVDPPVVPVPTTPSTSNPSAGPSSVPSPDQTSSASAVPSVEPISPVPGSPIHFEVVDNETVGGAALEGISFNLSTGETPSVAELTAFSSVPAGSILTVTTPEGVPVESHVPVSTGQIVTVTSTDGAVLSRSVVVVMGDVLGTGKMSLSQLVRMASAFRGTDPLTGSYLAAGDLTESQDGQITLSDLVREAQLLRASGWFPQTRAWI